MTQIDVTHPSDEMLLATLHQPSLGNAAAIRSHVGVCEPCAGRWRELSAEEQLTADLLGALDDPMPARLARATFTVRRPHRVRRALAMAGPGALIALAAAAMILPASPVRRWIRAVRIGAPAPRQQSRVRPVAPSPLASGIAVAATPSLVIVFRREQHGGVVQLARSSDTDVTFRSRGGVTAYEVASGRVTINNQAPAEVYLIALPVSVRQVRLLVGDRLLLRWPDDSSRIAMPNSPQQVSIPLDAAPGNVP